MLLTDPPKLSKLDALTNQGLDAYTRRNYPRALKKFEAGLRIRKEDQTLREAAAFAATRAEDWPRAAKHWRVVLRADPRRGGPYQQYINALLQDLKSEEALRFCRTFRPLQQPGQRGLRDTLLVRVHLMAGQTDEAHRIAERCYAEAPEKLDILTLAKWFFDAKAFTAAQRWLDLVPPTGPKADQAQMLRARIAYERKSWEAATKAFKAVAASANDTQARKAEVFLARIAAHQGDQQCAEARWQAVLDHSPHHAEATTFLIRSALGDQDPARALTLLESHWAHLDPARRVLLKARALAATDRSAALAFFHSELTDQPDLIALRRDYAQFLLEGSDWEGAADQIQRCLAKTPNDVALRKLHLRALTDMQAPLARQLEAAQHARSLAPRDVSLLNTVGGLLVRLNRRAAAVDHYSAAIDACPDAPILWRNCAYHLVMENRPAEARALADRAIGHLGTQSPEDLANAAWILQAAGRLEKAIDYITRALIHDPNALRAHQIALDLHMAAGNFAAAWSSIRVIDTLQTPRRDPRTAHCAAQCAAAFRAVAGAQGKAPTADIEPIPGHFPERLFHAIVHAARPDAASDRQGVLHLTSNLGAGGAERQVASVMQSLTHHPLTGDRVSLAVNSLDPVLSNDFFLPDIADLGLEIIDLDARRTSAQIRHICAHFPNLSGTVRSLAALPAEISRVAIPFYAQLIDARPRVVHLWQDAINVAGGIAAVAAGVPHIVLCTRSTRPIEIRRHRRYLREGYLALFDYLGRVDTLNNSANGARDYANWLEITPDKIRVFPNGYDFEAIRARATPDDRAAIRAKLRIPAAARIIGGVMRFSAEKRPDLWVDTVLAATKTHNDVHGLIVGDGPMRLDLMQRVAKLGLTDRIHFVGRQSPVEPWMTAMDILFLSSVTEGLPNVLIEAQALGLPVASMNVGGASEAFAAGQTGLLLPEAAPRALARDLCALLTDTPRLSAMAAAGPAFVDKAFSLATMRDGLARCYGPNQGGPAC